MGVVAQPLEQPHTADTERAAACALAGLGGIGGQSLGLIRDQYGTLTDGVRQGAAALAKVPGLRADGVASLLKAGDLVQRGEWLVAQAHKLGARILLAWERDYPRRLVGVMGAPPVLYVLGKLEDSGARRVAVVGTRSPDRYGVERTEAMVDQFCAAGVDVISGGAKGVDTVAHERTLARGGHTVAVVGSGFLHPYPEENRPLFERLAREGAMVSEFALDAGGNRTHFPQRNRTMAGLSDAVVVTRGKGDSGALTTVHAAKKLDRPVFGVPGKIGEPLSEAPNSVLSDGGRAAVTGAEILRTLGVSASPVTLVPVEPPVASAPDVSNLPASVQLVWGKLGAAPKHIDELAAEVNLATAECLTALLQLELAGLCAARPGKYFVRR